MYHVNNVFKHEKNDEQYVIKGAWDGAHPEVAHCWLMRSDGIGHTYAGKVTRVRNVWNISEDEFKEMTGAHREWFELVEEGPTPDSERKTLGIKTDTPQKPFSVEDFNVKNFEGEYSCGHVKIQVGLDIDRERLIEAIGLDDELEVLKGWIQNRMSMTSSCPESHVTSRLCYKNVIGKIEKMQGK